MSRKHFKALAEAIKGIECSIERERMASLIGNVCAECNSNFNWSIWNNACGITADAAHFLSGGGN